MKIWNIFSWEVIELNGITRIAEKSITIYTPTLNISHLSCFSCKICLEYFLCQQGCASQCSYPFFALQSDRCSQICGPVTHLTYHLLKCYSASNIQDWASFFQKSTSFLTLLIFSLFVKVKENESYKQLCKTTVTSRIYSYFLEIKAKLTTATSYNLSFDRLINE